MTDLFDEWYDTLSEDNKKSIIRYYFNTNYTTNSVIKGKIGEDFIEVILKKRYNIVLKNATKNKKSSDFQIKIMNKVKEILLLIEVKNYSTKIATKEVNKFYRDIEVSGADCGLFISINSDITGISETIQIVEHNNINIIFLHLNLIVDKENIIYTLIDILINLVKQTITIDYLKLKIENLNNSIKLLKLIRDEFDELQTSMMKKINVINTYLIIVEKDLNDILKLL